MKILNDDDYELLKKLISFDQSKTKEFVEEFLGKYYPESLKLQIMYWLRETFQ